jgi:hypothetical protein
LYPLQLNAVGLQNKSFNVNRSNSSFDLHIDCAISRPVWGHSLCSAFPHSQTIPSRIASIVLSLHMVHDGVPRSRPSLSNKYQTEPAGLLYVLGSIQMEGKNQLPSIHLPALLDLSVHLASVTGLTVPAVEKS